MEHSFFHGSLTNPWNENSCHMVPSHTHGTFLTAWFPHIPLPWEYACLLGYLTDPRNITAWNLPSPTPMEHCCQHGSLANHGTSCRHNIFLQWFLQGLWKFSLSLEFGLVNDVAFRCPPLRNPRPNDGSVCTVHVHQHCLYMNFCPRNEYAPISLYCSIRPFGLCVSVLYIRYACVLCPDKIGLGLPHDQILSVEGFLKTYKRKCFQCLILEGYLLLGLKIFAIYKTFFKT